MIEKLIAYLRAKLPPETWIAFDGGYHELGTDLLAVRLGPRAIVIEYHPTIGFGITRLTTADAYYRQTAPDVQCSDIEATCEQAIALLTTELAEGGRVERHADAPSGFEPAPAPGRFTFH